MITSLYGKFLALWQKVAVGFYMNWNKKTAEKPLNFFFCVGTRCVSATVWSGVCGCWFKWIRTAIKDRWKKGRGWEQKEMKKKGQKEGKIKLSTTGKKNIVSPCLFSFLPFLSFPLRPLLSFLPSTNAVFPLICRSSDESWWTEFIKGWERTEEWNEKMDRNELRQEQRRGDEGKIKGRMRRFCLSFHESWFSLKCLFCKSFSKKLVLAPPAVQTDIRRLSNRDLRGKWFTNKTKDERRKNKWASSFFCFEPKLSLRTENRKLERKKIQRKVSFSGFRWSFQCGSTDQSEHWAAV